MSAAIRPTRRRLTIMSALATGWLPWGVRWWKDGETPTLPRDRNEYLLCCGHVLGAKEAAAFVAAGLLEPGPLDRFGRETLTITDAGRQWLSANW